ncbi:MAG: tetratricopeptide repeat protein, partial [Bacteroidota bacterium]
ELQNSLKQLQQEPHNMKVMSRASDLFFHLGQFENAVKGYQHLLQFQPFNASIFYKLGLTYLRQEDKQAIDTFKKALKYLDPMEQKSKVLIRTKLAKAYKLDEQYEKAKKLVSQILKKEPQNASAMSILGQLEQQDENTEKAHELFLKVIELIPKNSAAHLNAGATAFILKEFEASIKHYQNAIQLKPKWANPHREMARAYEALGQADQALVLLKTALKIAPKEVENYKYLSAFYRAQGNHKQAVEVSKRVTQLAPDDAEGWFNVGSSMTQVGITDACLPYFEKAFELSPSAQAAYAIGNIHQTNKKIEEADVWFQKAIEQEEDYYTAIYQLISNRAAKCDWSQRAADHSLILGTLQKHLESERTDLPLPTLYFNYFDVPMEWHKAYNIHYSKTSEKQGEKLLKQFPISHSIKPKKRLRIGYISPDFRDHPVGRLVSKLFQHHDRTQFEVYGYSLAIAKEDDLYRPSIEAGFDVFRELCFLPTVKAAEQIVEDEIDILIDLGGHTAHTRPDILAMQPAPVQAHMIGYPNTMGANYMQYILADSYLVPEKVFEYYTEKVIQMPTSFLGAPPMIPNMELTRSEVGLPEEGVVFVAFNRPSKIEPELFQVWMNILKAVEGSVLWLSDFAEVTRKNLQATAEAAGVDPNRLIFSEWQPYGKYIKSHQLCDLFLDTWHYSAGSTAIAAIGAGLPMLTVIDDSNASRMGASIVSATGLTELICEDLAAYEAKAIELANNPAHLQKLKQQLVEQRSDMPLFNNALFAKQLEVAFWEMWERELASGVGAV